MAGDRPKASDMSPLPKIDTLPFEPTRAAGLARLDEAAPRFGRHYRDHRNHDLGPDDRTNVSVL